MKRIRTLASLLWLVALPGAAWAGEGAVPLTDAQLAELRGGFALPGGGDLNLGVVTSTYVDGALVVRSTYTVTGDTPAVQVSARGADAQAQDLAISDGQTVATADGQVTLVRTADGTQVRFSGDQLNVTALSGRNIGSIVQNSGNDRTIGVVTNIDLGLTGVARDGLGSSLSRAGTLALDATTRLAR